MAFPYRGSTVVVPHGMVCSVDPLASSAGVAMLRAGGSAADAAVAASAVLAVTSPHLCGIGGDLLAIVHDRRGAPTGLDATGRTGRIADAERLRAEGHTKMPFRHDMRSVTLPGCVDGWLALHERYGQLPLEVVLEPAVDYADQGFPASSLLCLALTLLDGVSGRDTLIGDDHPRAGAILRRPALGRTLRAIARGGRSAFYEGVFGTAFLDLAGGDFHQDDLHDPLARWVDPIHLTVWGHDVWTMPPSSQGYLSLSTLRIAEQVGLPEDPDDGLWCHVLVEAARVAGYDRLSVLHQGADPAELLDPDRLAERAVMVRLDRALDLPTPTTQSGDTMFLCVIDGDRRGVSLIQSNAADFGAHIVEPTTGVFLHNRGTGFSLEPGHPAEYGPQRRPPSTLSPALVTRADGTLHTCVGTMGGDGQPQIVAQLVARLLHAGQSPGSSLTAPRWVLRDREGTGFSLWSGPGPDRVGVEPHAPPSWEQSLVSAGHETERLDPAHPGTGHAQVLQNRGEVLAGAAEPRAGGAAAGY